MITTVRSVEGRRRPPRLARRDLQFDILQTGEALPDAGHQVGAAQRFGGQRAAQDFAQFVFHRAAMAGGPPPQPRLEVVVDIADHDTGHAASPPGMISLISLISNKLISDRSGPPGRSEEHTSE